MKKRIPPPRLALAILAGTLVAEPATAQHGPEPLTPSVKPPSPPSETPRINIPNTPLIEVRPRPVSGKSVSVSKPLQLSGGVSKTNKNVKKKAKRRRKK
jgi:hypothetical protein